MNVFSPKALRMLKALEIYKKNCKTWDAMHVLSKVKIEQAADGRIVGSFKITDDICNMGKSLHGGFTASVIDAFSVFGVIHHDKGDIAYTTDMNIMYIGKGQLGDVINVESKPIYVAKSRATMECTLTVQKKGWLIAKATTGFIMPDPPVLFIDAFPFDPRKDRELYG